MDSHTEQIGESNRTNLVMVSFNCCIYSLNLNRRTISLTSKGFFDYNPPIREWAVTVHISMNDEVQVEPIYEP